MISEIECLGCVGAREISAGKNELPRKERNKQFRVLVLEDSQTARDALVHFFDSDPEPMVAGTAANGREAVANTLKLEPVIITMDVMMPDMDGVEATKLTMRQRPTHIVVVTANAYCRESKVAFEALRGGPWR